MNTLRDWLEYLIERSRGCLDEETISLLYNASKTSIDHGGEPPGEPHIVVTLPNRARAVIPVGQLPEAWENILHIYCLKDYDDSLIGGIGDDWIIVDAGAYIGFYTLYTALKARRGLVVAIEPSPWQLRILRVNVKLNRLDNVVIVDRALWSSKTRLKLYVSCYWANTSIYKHYSEEASGVCGVFEVDSVTLDDLARDIGVNHIDLLKVDVEGAELEVLKGAKNTLSRNVVRRLIIEVHEDLVDSKRIVNTLLDYGYTVRTRRITSRQAIVYAVKH